MRASATLPPAAQSAAPPGDGRRPRLDDPAPPPRPGPKGATAAKYVQGRVGMLRSPGNFATKLLHGQRDGVIVIDVDDGGSLTFYKEISKPVVHYPYLHRRGAEENLTIGSEQSIFTRGVLNKGRRASVRALDVDAQVRDGIDKVRVSVSAEAFVRPLDMPYLAIPAAVPWQFKSVGDSLMQSTFQIVVPPYPGGRPDRRVRVMTPWEKARHTRQVITTLHGREVSYASVIRRDDDDDDDDDDDGGSVASTASSLSLSSFAATVAKAGPRKGAQTFTFRCENPRELAVYAEAAVTLGRAHAKNRFGTLHLLQVKTVRTRNAEGMEVAAQTSLLTQKEGPGKIQRRLSSIGKQEFRVLPLHVYPNVWMTKQELAEDLVRTSCHFHDLRKGSPEEIGCVRIEILQGIGIKSMDTYSLSDVHAYVVCGSSAFITDIIPNNLNPVWLPKTRRACILPLRNAYSQIYVGAFDYDGEKETDDFEGRVVLDLPQLQAGFLYDVTLPLRTTARIYNRKKLGCVRLRIQVNWTHGERSALLSYLPKSLAEITRRLKKDPPDPLTLISCPDAKSFQNICRTMYGEDIPGKFNGELSTALSREIVMINKVVEYNAKRVVRDIISWANPLLSGYIFMAWMYFVRQNSLTQLPSFSLSLVLICMFRNYLKYNVHSVVGSFYGHRSISSMCRTLLLNRHDSVVCTSQIQRSLFNQTRMQRLMSKVFGISAAPFGTDCWKEEDHAEYPFSVGSNHSKLSLSEAAAAQVWDAAAQDISSSRTGEEALHSDNDDDEWNSDEEGEEGLLRRGNQMMKKGMKKGISNTKQAISDHRMVKRGNTKISAGFPLERTGPRSPGDQILGTISESVSYSTKETLPVESAEDAPALASSTYCMPTKSGTTLLVPDQNVNTKVSKKGTLLQDVEGVHEKVSRANFHLFDDRVFVAEDRGEAQRLLALNNSNNPIRRAMNPIMSGVMKILDLQISSFRAVFNLWMWKDPMLSFWFTALVFGLMLVLSVFPWRLFFFVVGLLGLGPQNHFVVPAYFAKKAARIQKKKEAGGFSQAHRLTFDTVEDVANSPLLFRDNVQMKADGKRREVIVPGGDCVFRSNRFYDWPPDPATTTIKEGM